MPIDISMTLIAAKPAVAQRFDPANQASRLGIRAAPDKFQPAACHIDPAGLHRRFAAKHRLDQPDAGPAA
jgi:hypothetical protein